MDKKTVAKVAAAMHAALFGSDLRRRRLTVPDLDLRLVLPCNEDAAVRRCSRAMLSVEPSFFGKGTAAAAWLLTR